MSLDWLHVSRFRNLADLQFEFSPGLNLITGDNGAGKTSLLESCYYLTTGRSFKSSQLDPLIQRGESDFLLRGGVTENNQSHEIGISRADDGARDLRLDGEKAVKTSELARLLPMLVLGPESVDLLLGPPANRRRFLNWGLFHVKQSFQPTWENANQCLRQRNQVLRDGGSNQVLESWTEQLVEHSQNLDQLRSEYVEGFNPIFQQIVAELSGFSDVVLEYHPGWDRSLNLADIYRKDTQIDRKKGFTNKGFQRADVRIRVAGETATKVCSRGELKSIVWSLYMAQGARLKTDLDRNTAYLIDDLGSEFDADHRRKVGEHLIATQSQIFVTGVDKDQLIKTFEQVLTSDMGQNMFHVKHYGIEHGSIASESEL